MNWPVLANFAAIVLATTLNAGGEDLREYIAARKKWSNNQIEIEPQFDRKLCGVRLLEGLRQGVIAGLGAGVITTVTGVT